jgi:hypothetical protein
VVVALVLGPPQRRGGLLEGRGGERVEVGSGLLDGLDGLEAGLLELDAAALQGGDAVAEDVVAQAEPFEGLVGSGPADGR